MLQPPQRGFARTTNELYFGNPAVDNGHDRRATRRPRDDGLAGQALGVRLPAIQFRRRGHLCASAFSPRSLDARTAAR